MAKKTQASAQDKIAYLKANRGKFTNSSEANKLLQKKFGTGLIYGQISKALGLKRTTPVRKTPQKKAAGKKRGPGRPKGSRNKKTAGKRTGTRGRRPKSGGSETPAYVVVVPGRGRGWTMTSCSTLEDALALANTALAKGTDQTRIGIYTAQAFSVRTAPVIEL